MCTVDDLFNLIDDKIDIRNEDLSYKQLGRIIHQVKNWLVYDFGMEELIMNHLLFNKIGRVYTREEILKEKDTLLLIKNKLNRIPEWYFNKQANYIKNRKFIIRDGKWSPESKYDTNYSVQSLILSDLILMGKNDINCPFDVDFNDIYNQISNLTPYYRDKPQKELRETNETIKKCLNNIKDKNNTLKDIIEYYFPDPDCFKKYMWKALETTDTGDKAEEAFIKVSPRLKYEIKSRGFNGSVVDIAFGIDFIIIDLKTGDHLSVQVKNSKPGDYEINKYFKKYIDFVVWLDGNYVVLMDKERKTIKVKI
jgi:hypothetical protein